MKIGVRLPTSGAAASPENIVKVARWAQQLGFHSLWVTDHVAIPATVDSYYPYAPDNRWTTPTETPRIDALLALAWAAAAAPALEIGTSVLVLPLRHPLHAARQLSSLDALTGGRLIVGIGAGWMKEEFDLLGVPFDERGKRTVEMVELMRRLWTGGRVDFQGQFWQVAEVAMHPTPTRQTLPIIWGGHSNVALRRVARLGDGWQPTWLGLADLKAHLDQLHHYCEQYGRDPASLLLVVRPSGTYPITRETQARHHELGFNQVIADPPLNEPDLSDCYAEMQRLAEVCDLSPR